MFGKYDDKKRLKITGNVWLKDAHMTKFSLTSSLAALVASVYNEQVFFQQFVPDREWTGLFLTSY